MVYVAKLLRRSKIDSNLFREITPFRNLLTRIYFIPRVIYIASINTRFNVENCIFGNSAICGALLKFDASRWLSIFALDAEKMRFIHKSGSECPTF